MQSSYNFIRASNASLEGKREITTKYNSTKVVVNEEEKEDIIPSQEYIEQKGEEILESYRERCAQVLNSAQERAEEILENAKSSAEAIEKTSYENGYLQGKSNGYEDGYKEGYSKAQDECYKEISTLINRAETILLSSNKQYEEYLKEKEKCILDLALNMAKIIAKKEFEKTESILSMINPLLEEAKGEENIVIRCNSKYIELLESKKDYFIKYYRLKGEIFILEDPLMELGNITIENKNGKSVVGSDIAIEKIEEIIKEYSLGGQND